MDQFKRILVGVDDSDDAILAFRYAIDRAKRDDAQLYLVSVLETEEINVFEALTKDYVHGERKDLEQHMQKYVEEAQKAGVKDVQAVVASGNAGETIVKDVIPHVEPDLLVIGSHSKKGIARHFGSQAAYMAQYSPTSVMVIR
ncbi:universal stress protein [Nicoliella spurrieriana]|uniref:Universal stress protein n=1 Tax=Nicoliella spurrieriana TaxID=2925830 RepID=A0A976RT25_9LACO|nr:universal stress protein [Nicoliella spurrieriana]UQS87363.1 universal stress protein [Nicoliella spurrieriana]